MRYVELVPGVSSSVLGFGCAPILGAVGASTAQRAVDCALDCGITHFDLARSYGYGEAEAFVGRAMRGKRDTVVLASKFGIRANWKARLLRPLKPCVRIVRTWRRSAAPGHSGASLPIPVVADRMHDRVPLRGKEMRKSLEQSLRALRTDYLDILFVHEPKERLQHVGELSETAAALKAEGKIRAWGLALCWQDEALHRHLFDQFDILQLNNSPSAPHYAEIRDERSSLANVFFSPFRGASGKVNPAQHLRSLFSDFSKSVVLCSMFQEAHIRENAEAVE